MGYLQVFVFEHFFEPAQFDSALAEQAFALVLFDAFAEADFVLEVFSAVFVDFLIFLLLFLIYNLIFCRKYENYVTFCVFSKYKTTKKYWKQWAKHK